MTDILCNWLNNELKLSVKLDATNFAREFATGYLIGEVLDKHQLLTDFDLYSQSKTADSKLNNFTRMEPVLHLLGVNFDTNVARDIMTEKSGTATRVLYQLFIGLNKKEKAKLTGVAMETMRPSAPVKLEGVESIIYKERLKHLTPRQTDLNLDALVSRFHEKQIKLEETAFKDRFNAEQQHEQMLAQKREELIAKYKDNVAKRSEMLAKIQAATVVIPKTPPSKSAKAIQTRRQQRRELEAEDMRRELEAFDERLKRTLPPSKPLGEEDAMQAREVAQLPESLEILRPGDNTEYITKIRKTLNEDAQARSEREKRRRKVLVDQMKAHEAQEEAKREEMLVNRLMRQSQQERRIAVQLLQTRHEKEVIRRNRLSREKQYETRRLKEFEEAMNKEKEMARLAKLDYEEQTRLDREQHDTIMAERAEERYRKHYSACADILGDILDFSSKVTEYRELTNKLVPQKLYREWKALFVEGKPIYEVAEVSAEEASEPTPEQILEEERQQLLDEGDFSEYRQMIGEWTPPEDADPKIEGPPKDNPIVGHIVQRLFDIVHPPTPPPPPPEFPAFPIKACVLGKPFAGKSSCIKKLAEFHRTQALVVDELVQEAIKANNENEMIEIPEEPEPVVAETPIMSTEPTIIDDNATGDITIPPPEDDGTSAAPGTAAETPAPTVPATDDGAEKSDPEKPVPAEEENNESKPTPETSAVAQETKEMVNESPSHKSAAPATASSKASKVSKKTKKSEKEETVERVKSPAKPQPTVRNKLGGKALKFLKKGKACDDQLLVDIVVDAIKHVPEGTGWLLDGFPATSFQAKLLEKALTGGDGMSKEDSKTNLKESEETEEDKDGKKGGKKSKLAPDPKPTPPAQESGSGINAVVLFDISNENVLKRSAGRTYSIQTGEQYHEEFKPPPEGTTTGLGDDKVLPVEDASHEQEQIQHRLNAFNDSWPRMEKWFNKFNSLVRVDASLEEESVFLEFEKILEDTIKKIEGIALEESVILESSQQQPEEPPKEEEKPPEPEPIPEPPKEEERSRPSSRKSGSRAGSAKRSGSRGSKDKKDDKKASRAGSKAESKKSGKASRDSSAKSKGKKGSAKKGKSPTPEPEPEPEERPGTPPPEPGSDEWVYVDEPIDEELARVLSPYWEEIEGNYINSSKTVFRKVRQEREKIIRYLYKIRKDYVSFLKRPDTKQEYVSQWQKDFNEVPDDVREDEETRGELHERVDDLRERLWTICDERKDKAEKEREQVMGEGWLEDRLGILSNHYITVVQTEVDRFQDTLRMLKDYYRGMEGKIPDEQSSDYARIPLIELPPTVDPNAAPGEGDEVETPKSPAADENKSTTSKSGMKKGKGSQEDIQEKKKIPLVPRRVASPDPNAPAAKGKDAKGKKPNAKEEEMPPPPADPDQKLIYDAHCNGVICVDKMVSQEQAAREAEEAAEREREAAKEAEKQKAAAAAAKGKGKDKKGKKSAAKSRSPSPKKGDKSPSAATPQPEEEVESEEEKQRKIQMQRARQEFFHALQEEAEASKKRMTLVKQVAMRVLETLKQNSDSAYKDMHDWLGARFLKEMESIDQMSEVMRYAIEEGTKIKEELVLKQEEFLVNEDTKILKTPSPEPRPEPSESVRPDYFTVDQILNMYEQFALTAPSGVLSLTAFEDIFRNLTSLTHGTERIPDMWMNVTSDKLEHLSQQLSADGEYIDWRAFLLAAARPWPSPSQEQLLATRSKFKDMDQKDTGYVTREQFERVELWFHGFVSKPQTPAEPSAPYPYDRLTNLSQAFFDIFADHNMDPPQLDYERMLLYFAGHENPYVGFLRALSVAVGEHMPRIPIKLPKEVSRPASQASLIDSVAREPTAEELETLPTEDDIPESALQAKVPLDSLEQVLHFGQKMRGDSHRFSVQIDPEDLLSKERLEGIYHELGCDANNPAHFTLLIEHPIVQDIIVSCSTFKAIDLKNLLQSVAPAEQLELQSQKTAD